MLFTHVCFMIWSLPCKSQDLRFMKQKTMKPPHVIISRCKMASGQHLETTISKNVTKHARCFSHKSFIPRVERTQDQDLTRCPSSRSRHFFAIYGCNKVLIPTPTVCVVSCAITWAGILCFEVASVPLIAIAFPLRRNFGLFVSAVTDFPYLFHHFGCLIFRWVFGPVGWAPISYWVVQSIGLLQYICFTNNTRTGFTWLYFFVFFGLCRVSRAFESKRTSSGRWMGSARTNSYYVWSALSPLHPPITVAMILGVLPFARFNVLFEDSISRGSTCKMWVPVVVVVVGTAPSPIGATWGHGRQKTER